VRFGTNPQLRPPNACGFWPIRNSVCGLGSIRNS